MSDVVSTRLKKDEIKELNEISENERIDKSALIRKFLLNQIVVYRLKQMGEKYRKGLVSLAEAATLAKVSVYDMMEYIQREKIQPPALSKEEMEEELKNAQKILSPKKKK